MYEHVFSLRQPPNEKIRDRIFIYYIIVDQSKAQGVYFHTNQKAMNLEIMLQILEMIKSGSLERKFRLSKVNLLILPYISLFVDCKLNIHVGLQT